MVFAVWIPSHTLRVPNMRWGKNCTFFSPWKWICVSFWYYWICVGGGACS